MSKPVGLYLIYRYDFAYNCVPEGYMFGRENEAREYCIRKEESDNLGWYFDYQELMMINPEVD